MIEELVQADNEQLPTKEIKTLLNILSVRNKIILVATFRQERLKKHQYQPYFSKVNDKEKRVKSIQTFDDSHDEFRYPRRTNEMSRSLGG